MHVYTILIVFICESLAHKEMIEQAPNVGSVLFRPDHLKKKYWHNNDIALLEARKRFQNLIPRLKYIDTVNDNYVDTLLDYFRNAYTFIKKEASDAESDSIMTTALSDAIGGYLKLWALPVTKYNFYGGTISTENALKLYLFYNQLKSYLATDGNGWRNPDDDILRSMTINVARSPRRTYIRSMEDPCEHLFLYERTPTGLTAPIPYINWEDNYGTMFLPLKNQSFISLSSPKSSEVLFKYYDLAKNCMRSISPKDQKIFDVRFQNWLTNDVVPHLSDENLYIAFGSVLSLVNRTRDLCDKVLDNYETKLTTQNRQPFFSNICVNVLSKKFLFIMLLICLEAAWCIPAVIYILCLKKKGAKKNLPPSNLYLFLDSNKQKKHKPTDASGPENHKKKHKRNLHDAEVGRTHVSQEPVLSKANINDQPDTLENTNVDQVLPILEKPKPEKLEVASCASTYSIGTRSKSYFDSNVCSAELLRAFSKTPVTSGKAVENNISKSKMSHVEYVSNYHPTNKMCQLETKQDNKMLKRSFAKQSDITPPAELFTENEKKVKRSFMQSTSFVMQTLSEYRQAEIVTEKISGVLNIAEKDNDEETIECHCTCTPENKLHAVQTDSVIENEEDELIILSDKETEVSKHKLTRFNVKEAPKTPITGVKLNSGTPYLEIGLVRPEKSKFHEKRSDKSDKVAPIPTLTPKCNKDDKSKKILPIKSFDVASEQSARTKNNLPKMIKSEITKRESHKTEVLKKDSIKPETSKTGSPKTGLKLGPWQIKSSKFGNKPETSKVKKNDDKNATDINKSLKDNKVLNKIELAKYRKNLENTEKNVPKIVTTIMGENFPGSKNEPPTTNTSTPRPSRIPKKSYQVSAATVSRPHTMTLSRRIPTGTTIQNQKSHIPTLIRGTLDDSAIKKTTKKDSKLNVTL